MLDAAETEHGCTEAIQTLLKRHMYCWAPLGGKSDHLKAEGLLNAVFPGCVRLVLLFQEWKP